MATADSEKQELAEILKLLPGDKVGELMEILARQLERRVSGFLPDAIENFFEKLGYSEEIHGLTHLLAAKSGESKEEILLKALTLYGFALDAKEKGDRLAILNSEDEIVRDIIGYGAAEKEHQAIDK